MRLTGPRASGIGRLAPDGPQYVNSWVTEDFARCCAVMACADRALRDEWIDTSSDLVEFEVISLNNLADAATLIAPRL